MNRTKETLIYVLAAVILFGVFMKFGGRYFTPAAVARANELGLHYGPSQKVLLEYKGSENNKVFWDFLEVARRRNKRLIRH